MWYFYLYLNFNRTFCKQIVDPSNQGLHCLLMSHKKAARRIWVKHYKEDKLIRPVL